MGTEERNQREREKTHILHVTTSTPVSDGFDANMASTPDTASDAKTIILRKPIMMLVYS